MSIVILLSTIKKKRLNMSSQTGIVGETTSTWIADDGSMQKVTVPGKVVKSWALPGLIGFIILVIVLMIILYIIKPQRFVGTACSGLAYFVSILIMAIVIALIIALIAPVFGWIWSKCTTKQSYSFVQS